MTNRALVLAALADGETVIQCPLAARDTLLMRVAVERLGAEVREEGPVAGDCPRWRVRPGQPAAGRVTIEAGNAGTVLRFVPPVAALSRAVAEFRGDPRAAQRPVQPLLDALVALGANIDAGGPGSGLFTVRGQGGLPGGTVTLDASSSSQLVSGLLLAAARFAEGAEVRHSGPPVPSMPHVDMTVAMLRQAGAQIETRPAEPGHSHGEQSVPPHWHVYPGQLAPGRIAVEPDLSNAAPFLAAALVTGGEVTIAGWPAEPVQPGRQIIGLFTRMGASCSHTPDGLRVRGTGRITGIAADVREVSELVPVLAAVAALAGSPSEFRGVGHMRRHESDRLAALATEIGALGGDVRELDDGLRIQPRRLAAGGTVFGSHDDHRLVMAAAVLGLAVPGLRVGNPETVGKTFPGFCQAWSALLLGEQQAGGHGRPTTAAAGAAPPVGMEHTP
jgi:3-phosphoshikimate 1-carboxyvinyltransferase